MTDAGQRNEPIAWRISQQVQQIGRTESGNFVPGFLITFIWGNNNSGQVFIPEANYSEQTVHGAISSKVRTMVNVGNLSGQA